MSVYPPVCSVPSCVRLAHALELCQKHYKRKRYRERHPPVLSVTPDMLARFPILARELTADDITEHMCDRLARTFITFATRHPLPRPHTS